jgi:ubiquinone biosynthesis protein COQ4
MPVVQFHPIRAFRAARALYRDPDDLPQVFTIIESLSINTMSRILQRMGTLPSGQRLLAMRPDLVALLADRKALARLPDGSLGRAYLDFVVSENITAEGIRDASEIGKMRDTPLDPTFEWMAGRMRDTHDLWHAATGYTGDVLGESALLAFIFAQTWNPGVALIISLALLKTLTFAGHGALARKTILDGFKRGNNAEWLPAQEWEQLLALPLTEVRARLGLGAPPVYKPVRSAQLKAA